MAFPSKGFLPSLASVVADAQLMPYLGAIDASIV